jgi:UDP-glucose 4-epimerase
VLKIQKIKKLFFSCLTLVMEWEKKMNIVMKIFPLNPISLYGRTKCDAEKKLKAKNYVCFRLATVFGFSYRMRSDVMVNNFVFNAIKT